MHKAQCSPMGFESRGQVPSLFHPWRRVVPDVLAHRVPFEAPLKEYGLVPVIRYRSVRATARRFGTDTSNPEASHSASVAACPIELVSWPSRYAASMPAYMKDENRSSSKLDRNSADQSLKAKFA